ncbi:metal-dependent hydrolase [Streptomyces sp. GbtcB6]|uniref:metal-dependent hydrolase n=1 Tax=Streptomyces sp. GbtcB6 TaxID=2824751 RepID=UPI001C3002C1|nr:metal-dependent hydrolase [Streptomyces sp. GbtcB6]
MVHYSGIQVSEYLTDTYAETVKTKIIASGERDGTGWVAVERSLFHPQGGGQPADRGWLDEHEVLPVRDHDLGLITLSSADGTALPALADGDTVVARIDLGLRLRHAALHTAGHLVEAVVRPRGWTTVGNNHFPGQARVEFQTESPDPRLTDPKGREAVTGELREAIARAIEADLPVGAGHDGDGRRLIRLGDIHTAPCGGTHVRSLGELADVALPALRVKKGRIKVSYSAEHRAAS